MRWLWLVVVAACAGRAHAPNGPLVDVPRPGRNFEAASEAVASAHGDGYGIAYAGATSLENRYTLDGADIGDVATGGVGQTVPVEFLEELRVTTGGVGAESPGALGGLVELETRRGSNELHGGVFGTLAPSWLAMAAKTVTQPPQTIEVTPQRAYDADFGADLAGPIVKDKLFFFVGFAAELGRTDYLRRIVARDPVQEVARETREAPDRAYPFVLRLDGVKSYDHQGSLTLVATPSVYESPGLDAASTGTRTRGLALDAIAQDRTKWRDGHTEIETTLAWHRATREVDALDPVAGDVPGILDYDRQDRLTARIVATDRLRANGYHELKAGGSLEGSYDLVPRADATTYSSTSAAAFLQDNWQVKSNLTIDAGIRYQHQHLVDVATFDELAPRIGVVYDRTREGREKVFAHWGRYYEAVPVGVAEPSTFKVAPGVRAPYMDELLAGIERELWEGSVAAAFHQRRQRRVLEDIGTDGNAPFTLSNPPGANREYDALELSLSQHIPRFYLQASYTLSRTSGNYDGLIDYDNAQLQPNLTRAFDAPMFAANGGVLPQDRTHNLKIDATYGIVAGRRSIAVIGARLRAYSGAPQAALSFTDPAESLVPRGEFPRMPAVASLDVHAGLRVATSQRTVGEWFADIFNLFDSQPPYAVDNTYALTATQPIAGGTYSDLVWLRARRNPTFHRPTAYYAPLSVRLGFRLSF